mmetsp:Transcript_51830/g.160768  ORF Transcript_51830/g.160768 Transcript_51830/m.160768 type:complete len:433 (-) Transcript_51830:58-1356(-)
MLSGLRSRLGLGAKEEEPEDSAVALAGPRPAEDYGALAAGASTAKSQEVEASPSSSSSGVRIFEWEERGGPWTLLIGAGMLVARQYAALALICFQVFFISTSERKYLMSCNPYKIGWAPAYFCEWSKTCVRCFPLMAMVVSLVVAARLILHQRAFYLLLRRGVLVDFDNFSPLKDPLFWILLVTLALALFHFIFDIFVDAESSKTARLADPQGIILFYFAPAGYFLMFLYQSYDIEEMLVPMSKYWEEDPEWARQSSLKLVLAEETFLAKAVLHKGLRLEKRCDEDADEPEPREEPSQARTLGHRRVRTEVLRLQAAETEAVDPHASFKLSNWRHVSEMWASQLLLDPNLDDGESVRFRRMWCVFCLASLAAMGFAWFFFFYQIVTDVHDIFWPPYQNTDIPSLVVDILYLAFTGIIAYTFWRNLLGYKGSV